MGVHAAVLAELTELDLVDSAEGQIALTLAGALDDRAGVQNIAATAKQLQAGLDAIRARRPKVEDSVDQSAAAIAEKLRLVR